MKKQAKPHQKVSATDHQPPPDLKTLLHLHSHIPPLIIVDLFSDWRHCKTIAINLMIFIIMFVIVDLISMCE